MWFNLAMDHVSVGRSFRKTAAAIQHARDHTKAEKLTGVKDVIVGRYVRVLVGASLQDMSDMMEDMSVWAVSFAFDSRMHRGSRFSLFTCGCALNVFSASSIWSGYQCSICTRERSSYQVSGRNLPRLA